MKPAEHQLRHSFGVVSGATPQSRRSDYWDGEILWVTPEDVSRQPAQGLHDTRRKITQAGFESCATTIVPPGSIVLTKRAPIGQVAILARPACSNQGCFLLVPRGEQDSRYYHYWLSIQTARLQALGRGSTFMELSSHELKSLRIPAPTHNQQVEIADYLDREIGRIDALIAANERVIALLDEKRRAFISRAVTRGLDPNVPLRQSATPWLGEIPAIWYTRRLAWLFQERDERRRPELPLLEVSLNAGVVLRQFSHQRIEGTAKDFNTYKVARRNDVVFNKMRMWQGAVGTAPQDGLVSPDYVVATPSPEIHPRYAELLFRTPAFSAECARHSHGIVWDRLRLYWRGFRNIVVCLPTVSEQEAIARHIDRQVAELDGLTHHAAASVTLLRERRSAIISAATTGQITIERFS